MLLLSSHSPSTRAETEERRCEVHVRSTSFSGSHAVALFLGCLCSAELRRVRLGGSDWEHVPVFLAGRPRS